MKGVTGIILNPKHSGQLHNFIITLLYTSTSQMKITLLSMTTVNNEIRR